MPASGSAEKSAAHLTDWPILTGPTNALSLWIKGATFQQIAAAGFGIATASGAWRAVHRALAQIPKQEADQARDHSSPAAGGLNAALEPGER
jgi:hypothetical protein